MSEQDKPTTQDKPKPKQISVDVAKDLEAVYANLAFISHTPAEMVIDFAQILPRTPRGQIKSRVIMSPMHAKMLQAALTQNIANYERQFGPIQMPRNLAQQFFTFPQEGKGDKDE